MVGPRRRRGRRSGGRDLCSRAVGDRWGELLTPEPANAAAVALSAALAWAGASLLLQLALISFAIFATCRQVLLRRRAPPLRPHRSCHILIFVSGFIDYLINYYY
ncbi:Os12g0205633 [Oryza sativa Japonica Group]|uniref:Os12g0205633 protein n=1 Tax=Oryza sativa subsp. japonica TaxID=39947 RepID=A0A0P0Y7Z6_ORYSJ|nr:Os12g0205633 [Oryza sativa Japonica Group]